MAQTILVVEGCSPLFGEIRHNFNNYKDKATALAFLKAELKRQIECNLRKIFSPHNEILEIFDLPAYRKKKGLPAIRQKESFLKTTLEGFSFKEEQHSFQIIFNPIHYNLSAEDLKAKKIPADFFSKGPEKLNDRFMELTNNTVGIDCIRGTKINKFFVKTMLLFYLNGEFQKVRY